MGTIFLNLWLINIHATPTNPRLSYGWNPQFKSVLEVGFYLRVIKTKLFGNILMEALAPFAPL